MAGAGGLNFPGKGAAALFVGCAAARSLLLALASTGMDSGIILNVNKNKIVVKCEVIIFLIEKQF